MAFNPDAPTSPAQIVADTTSGRGTLGIDFFGRESKINPLF